MKMLICGEGSHDMGHSIWNDRIKDYKTREGWIQIFVRGITKKLDFGFDFEFETRKRNELPSLGSGNRNSRLKGHAKNWTLDKINSANHMSHME